MPTIRYDDEVTEWVAQAESQFPRIRETVKGIAWTLAHGLHLGHALHNGKRIYVLQSPNGTQMPDLWIRYSRESTGVTLHNIGTDPVSF